MRTISYTAKERRAANQVWNAAERYNFDPLFLAVETGDLDSDLYMNLIIGLAYKYYGEKAISTYLVIGTEISVRLCWMI